MNLTVIFVSIIRVPIFILIRVEVSLHVQGVYYARATECFLKVIAIVSIVELKGTLNYLCVL